MKNISFKIIVNLLSLFAIFFSCNAIAEIASRDSLVKQVESVYFQQQLISEDSPLLGMLLGAAKSKNPAANNETWAEVSKEVASKLTKVMLEQGGPIDIIFRDSLKGLSEDELNKLIQIFSDPTFKKFQTAFTNPSVQTKYFSGVISLAFRFNIVINEALVRHGLTEIH